MTSAIDAVRSAFPGRRVDVEGQGQMSTAFRVDDELIVRVPRHAFGVDRLRVEVEVLAAIRPYLDVSTPEIVDVALDLSVGRAYVAHRRIPGEVLRREDVSMMTPERLELIGRQIGRFLRDLHSIDPSEVTAVPVTTASELAAAFRAEVDATLVQILGPVRTDALARALAALESVPDRPLVLAHTDIGGNVVVDENGRIGIIDFGSCMVTHPGFDAASLSVLGPDVLSAAAIEHPLLASFEREAAAVAGTFLLQDALYGARQDDWAHVRAVFGLPPGSAR